MRFRSILFILLAALPPLLVLADEPPPNWTPLSGLSFDRDLGVQLPPGERLRADFSVFQIDRRSDAKVQGSSLRWQLQAREGVGEASLILPGVSRLDAVAVWVKNPAEAPLELSLRLTDASGETHTSERLPLLSAKGWSRVFLKASATPARTAELVLSGLQPATAYTIYLDELVVLQAPPAQVRVLQFTAPEAAPAGQALPVQLRLELPDDHPNVVPLTLRLLRAGQPASVLEVSVTDDREPLLCALPVPAHIAGGLYQLKITAPGAELSGQMTRLFEVQANPSPGRISIASPRQGGSFIVDGQVLPWIGGRYQPDLQCRQAPWILVPMTSDFDFSGTCRPAWLAPDKFDDSAAEEDLARALAANPGAYLIPVIHVSSPPWWDQQHPKDLMVYGDGKAQLPSSVAAAKPTFASWASATWRKDASASLTRLVKHLEEGPWGPAIIGYQIASGEGGNWVYPGATRGVFADYSASQQEAFRAWLRNKYRDIRSLRMAWGQPGAPVTSAEALKEFQPILGWSQVRIPSQAARMRAPTGVLHEPTAAQEIVDYQIFCSDLVAETIRLLANAVRSETREKKLVGVAYGHLFDLAASRCGIQNGGHLAVSPICEADELDFIVSPATALDPHGPAVPTALSASIADHGKLWLTVATAAERAAGLSQSGCGGGAVAVAGYSPQSAADFTGSLPAAMPRDSVSQIAVVVDDISLAYTAPGPELLKDLLSDQRLGLSLLGAPFDVWTLDDVLGGRADGYKLYIFLDAFCLDAPSRQALVKMLSSGKCTALWVYAPGMIDASIGSRTAKELTGLTLVQRIEKALLQVKVPGPAGYTYGTALPLSPRFACADDAADIRGTLHSSVLGGLAVKENRGYKSVWSAAPHLPASLLRGFALDADVHLYADPGDAVWVNRNLIALRAGSEGQHRVRLPRLATVYDLKTRQPLGRAANEFSVGLRAGETRLYYWGEAPLSAP